MILDASCEIQLHGDARIPLVLMLRPRSGLGQWVMREEYLLTPHEPVVEYTDPFGNLCQRIVAPPGHFHIHTIWRVDTADEIDVVAEAPYVPVNELPDDCLQYLLPSRYCEADMIGSRAGDIVGDAPAGYAQVEAIRAWIESNVEYRYGTSNASTSATQAFDSRVGVCRDFAHLGIALCRALNIPARMVVGYLHALDPMDLHAWFEAFVGGRWFTFDATQKKPRGNRITIAYGRDAADVALITQFGALELDSLKVTVVPAAESDR